MVHYTGRPLLCGKLERESESWAESSDKASSRKSNTTRDRSRTVKENKKAGVIYLYTNVGGTAGLTRPSKFRISGVLTGVFVFYLKICR